MKNIDKKYLVNDKQILAGTDEAGRGPLAGPVVAAAVIFPVDFYDERINDSKKLSASLRDELFIVIEKNSLAYAYTVISHKKIDEINILNTFGLTNSIEGQYKVIKCEADTSNSKTKVYINIVPNYNTDDDDSETGLRVVSRFRSTNWKSGIWTNGIYETGLWEGGIWYNGIFKDGVNWM